MMRLPRLLPIFSIGCFGFTALTVSGQETPAATPATPAAAVPATPATPAAAPTTAPAAAVVEPSNKPLEQAAEDFWHFASIGRFDQARAEAERVIALKAPPADVLKLFERIVEGRNRFVDPSRRMDLYDHMTRWQLNVPQLKESCGTLIATFNTAKKVQALDPAFIEQQIQRLGGGVKPYRYALEQLKESGEMAIPVMLMYLKDPARKELYIPIRSAIRDLGPKAVSPLLAATEMKDWNTLYWVIMSLGDLGYDTAVPYLVRLVKSAETPEPIKRAATESLIRIKASANVADLSAPQLYYELAEKLYYNRATTVAASKTAPVTWLWFWNGSTLEKKDVPSAVFNQHMALRCCEYVLALDPSRSDAVSLWVAAAYKRELDLPQGAVDPVWDDKHPSAHYYAVASGTKHLYTTLARALRDRDAGVALKSIKSLQEIAGASNLLAADGETPVLSALRYADRRVRFEAALAVAGSLPQKAFAGQEQVVPILAEALAQTGKPGLLVLASSQDEMNQRLETLGKSGAYNVKGGTTAEAALAAVAGMASVDVILANEKSAEQIDRLLSQIRGNVRVERAGLLVIVTSKVASSYAAIAQNDSLVTVTDAKDDAGLAASIEEARKRSGGLPLDEKLATEYALRSAELLTKLAISRGQVLDLSVAQNALLAAMDDARPEIAKAAGNVLALFPSKDVQMAIAAKVLEEKTADELRASFLKSLSTSAKFYGNQLEAAQTEALTKLVEIGATMDVRSAAAEAHGALNLPPDRVKRLIMSQAKK